MTAVQTSGGTRLSRESSSRVSCMLSMVAA
jgi:hypothetical protein